MATARVDGGFSAKYDVETDMRENDLENGNCATIFGEIVKLVVSFSDRDPGEGFGERVLGNHFWRELVEWVERMSARLFNM